MGLEASKGSIALAAETFIEALEQRGVQIATVARYRGSVREFAEFAEAGGVMSLRDALADAVIEAYVSSLRARGLAPRTAAERLRRLYTFLRWIANRHGMQAAGSGRAWITVGLRDFMEGQVRTFPNVASASPGEATEPPAAGHRRTGHGATLRRRGGEPPAVPDLAGLGGEDRRRYLVHAAEDGSIDFDRLVGDEHISFDLESGGAGAEPPEAAAEAAKAAAKAPDTAAAQPDVAANPKGAGGKPDVAAEPAGSSLEPRGERAEWPEVTAAPPVVAPPTARPDTIVQSRILEGKTTSHVAKGDRLTVDVRVALRHHGLHDVVLDSVSIPSGGIRLRLVVSAPGFDVLSEPTIRVVVPQAEDSAWRTFELRATASGAHTVSVLAFRGATYLGALNLRVVVGQNLGASAPIGATGAISPRPSVPGELSLIVRWKPTGDAGLFRYQLLTADVSDLDPVSTGVLVERPDLAIAELVRKLDSFAGDRSALSGRQRDTFLRDTGADLWARYVPHALSEQFWHVLDRARRLTIISGSDPLPWEIFFPVRPGSMDGGFLVERLELTRWRVGGAGPESLLPLGSTVFVVPSSGPDLANTEVAAIRALSPGLKGGSVVSTLDEMEETVELGAFDLLHFACHNEYAGGQQGVPFGSGPDKRLFEPVNLARVQGAHAYAARGPLVFMNACRTAGQDATYTALSGWADRFIEAGAGAFVGSMWAVRDTSARSFAERFYTGLVGGLTIGAATKAARLAVQSPGDPTWLAYAVFGDADARIQSKGVPA